MSDLYVRYCPTCGERLERTVNENRDGTIEVRECDDTDCHRWTLDHDADTLRKHDRHH